MKRRNLSIAVGAMVVPLLATSIQAASAKPAGPGKTGHQGTAAVDQRLSAKDPGASPEVITGYRRVNSAAIVDTAGQQTGGSVRCPSGLQVIGGGVVIAGSALTENINSSFPSNSTTWGAYVSNSGGVDGTFRVYAVCARKVSKYSLAVGTAVPNPAGAQTTATVTCPTGTVPLGGGGLSDTFDFDANMNTSIPLTRGWRVDMNNGSGADTTATAYAVCGKKPTAYAQVVGTPVSVNPGAQTSATASCPANTSVLGGGGYISTGSLLANLNSSVAFGTTGWEVYENNNNTSSNNLSARVVCGQIG